MPAERRDAAHKLLAIRFGGWYDGDNHKPGRGFHFVCSCDEIGLGQLLPASAERDWRKHVDRARWASKESTGDAVESGVRP